MCGNYSQCGVIIRRREIPISHDGSFVVEGPEAEEMTCFCVSSSSDSVLPCVLWSSIWIPGRGGGGRDGGVAILVGLQARLPIG